MHKTLGQRMFGAQLQNTKQRLIIQNKITEELLVTYYLHKPFKNLWQELNMSTYLKSRLFFGFKLATILTYLVYFFHSHQIIMYS